ncbi:MAG: hypothetical protein R6U46_02530 [Marinilabilia sp.]
MRNRIILAAGLLLFIFLLAFVSVKVKMPYTINGKGILLPEKEWKLTRNQDGTVNNILRDNRTHGISSFSSTEFGRGDHANFRLNDQISPNCHISKGDTIGELSSHQEQIKLMKLERELLEQEHMLAINQTGDKPQKISKAREELRMAEDDLETEKRRFERTQQLHKQDVIADQEYEEAQNRYNQKKQEVLIARANYEDLTAGSKKEERQLYETNIRGIEKQINSINDRLDALTITSPLGGTFSPGYKEEQDEENVLARIVSDRKKILMMPVEISNIPYVKENMKVIIHNDRTSNEVTGQILNISQDVKTLDGRQTVLTTSVIEDEESVLFAGLKTEATISGDSVSAFKYFSRVFKTIFTN